MKIGAFTVSHDSGRDLNLLSSVFSGSFDYQTSLLQVVSVKYRLHNVDCRPGVKCRLQTRGKMQTADCRIFNSIRLPFLLLRASDIQSYQGDNV